MKTFSKVVGVMALLALTLGGQAPEAQAPPAPPASPAPQAQAGKVATFSTSTRLVTVDVTVKDKAGKAIQGLKASDFAITEDGKPQKISFFEAENLTMEPEPPPTLSLADQLELPPSPKTTITVETPGQVQYHDKRLLAFYLDFSSMGIPEQLRAQDAAIEFLNKKITKDDMVAILLYTSDVSLLTDFTNDREVLMTILKGLPIGEMSELAGLADTDSACGQDTGAAFVADETEFNIFNTDQKLYAIEKIARMLSALPEKKQLIFFNAGISKTGIDNQAQLEATINASTKANMAIYPIDARGLMADPPGGGASVGGTRGAGIFNGSSYNSQRSSINDSQETLVSLAADTGGKAFLDSNDIELGIEQAQQANQSNYIIQYYSTNPADDGKYRKITVKLTNGQNYALDYRPGYWASKVWGKLNAQDKEQQLKEALAAGDPITDIPFVLQYDYFRVGPTTYFVPVSLKIPGSVVELAAKGGASVTQFDFIGQIQDETRAVAGQVQDYIKIKLDPETAEKSGQKSFQYDAGFTLEPGRYNMKFLVRENISGKMGTFLTHFVIPDLSADTSGLKLSTIVWSNQRAPLDAAVGTAGKYTKKDIASNPLIVGDQKIVPNITKVFRRNQHMYVSFDVYDAAPDPGNSKIRKIEVSLSLFNQKGAKAFEIGPLDATQLATTRPEAVPVNIESPLKDIVPGRYVCQINVVDEAGRKFAFRRAALVVAP